MSVCLKINYNFAQKFNIIIQCWLGVSNSNYPVKTPTPLTHL